MPRSSTTGYSSRVRICRVRMDRNRGRSCRSRCHLPLNSFLMPLREEDLPLTTAREAAYECAVMEAMVKGSAERKWIDVVPPRH